MNQRIRRTILSLRLTAVALMIAATYLLWIVMVRLSWQVDCLIAAAAAVAFAYKFEREVDQ